MVPQDQRKLVQLVKKVIVCLACASPDEQHPGVRYARLLNGLLRVFSRGVDGVTSQVSTPKRRAHSDLPSVAEGDMYPSKPALPPSVQASGPSTNGLSAAHTTAHTEMQSIAQIKHDDSPRMKVALPHALQTSDDAFYANAHAQQLQPPMHAHQSQSQPQYASSTQSFPDARAPQQQLFAAESAPAPTNGYNVNQPFDLFPSSNYNFQFDLNWPPVGVDGLAQMLTDDHSLDGDFWMSLPNRAQWQSWPSGTASLN